MITPRGDIHSLVWVITDSPSDQDKGAGVLISGAEGYHFDKLIDEVSLPHPYITSVEDNNVVIYDSNRTSLDSFLVWFHNWCSNNSHYPTILLLYDAKASELFCPETKNYKKPHDCKLDKWAGSLLVSPLIKHPHYCIPLWPISYVFQDWSYRDIYKFIDLGKAFDEYTTYTTTGSLRPLPDYRINSNPSFLEVIDWLDYCLLAKRCASDIETIRLSKDKRITETVATNYMYTIALAPSARESCAFSLWNWESKQRVRIWEKLNRVLREIPIIGQNYFQFDSHFEEAFGLEPNLETLQDTRIRHHILWPELPHSLQFMCKQYTRQKYYKDDGKVWSPKNLRQLLHYNALDTVVDYEVWEGQEVEFQERPHLI